jgi:hypothetical protein
MTLQPVSHGTHSLAYFKNQWTIQQRHIALDALTIGINAYYYRKEEEDLTFDHCEELALARGDQLTDGMIFWSDISFQAVEHMDMLTIEIVLRSKDSYRKYRMGVDRPKCTGPWKAGIRLHEGEVLEAQLVIGSQQCPEFSDYFTLRLD